MKNNVRENTICCSSTCTTTFTGFVRKLSNGSFGADGFWDIISGNDAGGPKGEFEGGTPYPYSLTNGKRLTKIHTEKKRGSRLCG
jgi:hypothetical protein